MIFKVVGVQIKLKVLSLVLNGMPTIFYVKKVKKGKEKNALLSLLLIYRKENEEIRSKI